MSAFTERRRALQALGLGVATAGAVMVTGSAGRRWHRRTSAREGCHEPALVDGAPFQGRRRRDFKTVP